MYVRKINKHRDNFFSDCHKAGSSGGGDDDVVCDGHEFILTTATLANITGN